MFSFRSFGHIKEKGLILIEPWLKNFNGKLFMKDLESAERLAGFLIRFHDPIVMLNGQKPVFENKKKEMLC